MSDKPYNWSIRRLFCRHNYVNYTFNGKYYSVFDDALFPITCEIKWCYKCETGFYRLVFSNSNTSKWVTLHNLDDMLKTLHNHFGDPDHFNRMVKLKELVK